MLIIYRYKKQSIDIYYGPEKIKLTVEQIKDNKVKLSFDGSKDFIIIREEIAHKAQHLGLKPTTQKLQDHGTDSRET